MKKLLKAVAISLIICIAVSAFAACDNQEKPTAGASATPQLTTSAPASASPTAEPTPTFAPTPTAEPTPTIGPTPVQIGKVKTKKVALEFGDTYAGDIDGDGQDENVSIKYDGSEFYVLTVSDNGVIFTSNLVASDMAEDSGRAEIIFTDLKTDDGFANMLISIPQYQMDYTFYILCYNGASLISGNIVYRDDDGTMVSKDHMWVSALVNVKNGVIDTGRCTNILGADFAEFELHPAKKLNTFEQSSAPYTFLIHDGSFDSPLNVIKSFSVKFIENGKETDGKLNPGDKICMIESDGYSYVIFEMIDGTKGRFDVTRGDHQFVLINGRPCDEYIYEDIFYD